MPDGIYLNARELPPKRLAQQINDIIEDKDLYYDYFRWRGYYSFFNPANLKGESEYCKFCKALNDKKIMTKPVTYVNLAEWWNRPPTYHPQAHNRNHTEPHTDNTIHFMNTDEDEILQIIDDNYPNSALLDLKTEASLPRANTHEISETGSKNKIRERKSKKKNIYTKAPSSENIRRHEQSHDKYEHDNHEHDKHKPSRLKMADRVLEWHDDLPESALLKPDVQADVQHLKFFFDIPTVLMVTEVHTTSTRNYIRPKSFVVS